jgi:hypothetical protein
MHRFFTSRAFFAGASATGLMAYSVTRSFAKADSAASPQSVKLNSNLLNPKCAGVASFLRLHGVSDVKTVLSNPFSGQDVNAGILMFTASCFCCGYDWFVFFCFLQLLTAHLLTSGNSSRL